MLGVSRSTVTRAKQAGRLVLDDRGRVLVDESLQRYHATAGGRTDVAERHAQGRGGMLPGAADHEAAAVDATSSDEDGDDEDAPASRKHYKALVLHYENENIRLEQALRRHERYPRKAVRREALALGASLRAAMERLVDEATPQLTIADASARREHLDDQGRALRRVLKAEMARALYRLRHSRE